jgi:hypothetical protein
MFILDNLANFDWCRDGSGIIKAMSFIKAILNVIRILVPIGLVGFTVFEVVKKVINPDDKDFMKKIGNRIIAAVVVFFVPLIVSLVLKIIDIGTGNTSASSNSLGRCWDKA